MANEMNFVRDTLEKVFRLSKILNYLNSNPLTKENLVLKGGMAINLPVFALPRLIDLDFSNNLSHNEMMTVCESLHDDLCTYMSTQFHNYPDPCFVHIVNCVLVREK